MLLTRDQFREGIFDRDQHKCVVCGAPAVDAHHIIERRLFPDGGYYLNNGASVCEEHHLACERTDISVEEIRIHAGITKKIVPPHLYADQEYDKWGNPVMPNGTRLMGELFFDESVQKIIKGHLDSFTHHVKYPRTHHLPWSPGVHSDDRVISSMDAFKGKEVVATIKMDGENTTMYQDYIHARSLDSRHHASRDWVKNFWGQVGGHLPQRWRLCGENLYAKHSIEYTDLPSFFMGFSLWNDRNECLDWDETLEWFELLDVEPVPVLYRGEFDEDKIKSLWSDSDWETSEGYVLRTVEGFPFSKFRFNVAKFVRENHVQTIKHWMVGQEIVPNKLRS